MDSSSFVGKKFDGSKEFGTLDRAHSLQLLSIEDLGSCPERLDQVQHHYEERGRRHHDAVRRELRPLLELELQASEAAALA